MIIATCDHPGCNATAPVHQRRVKPTGWVSRVVGGSRLHFCPDHDPRHGGSGSLYQRGCRCDACKTANRDRVERRRKERTPPPEGDARHGMASTYENWTCRCELCASANSAKRARDRARRSIT